MINPELKIAEGFLMLVPWAAPIFMLAIGATELVPPTGIFATGADIVLLALFKE